jgi:hypothetical protein
VIRQAGTAPDRSRCPDCRSCGGASAFPTAEPPTAPEDRDDLLISGNRRPVRVVGRQRIGQLGLKRGELSLRCGQLDRVLSDERLGLSHCARSEAICCTRGPTAAVTRCAAERSVESLRTAQLTLPIGHRLPFSRTTVALLYYWKSQLRVKERPFAAGISRKVTANLVFSRCLVIDSGSGSKIRSEGGTSSILLLEIAHGNERDERTDPNQTQSDKTRFLIFVGWRDEWYGGNVGDVIHECQSEPTHQNPSVRPVARYHEAKKAGIHNCD